MKLLTREEILAIDDVPEETVHVPEWGGSVRVRGLTGSQRDEFEASVVTQDGRRANVNMRQLRAKLCAYAIVGEDGKRLFTQADVETLGRKSAVALQRVFEVASRLSGLSREDVEELAKNSVTDLSGDSGSASPSG